MAIRTLEAESPILEALDQDLFVEEVFDPTKVNQEVLAEVDLILKEASLINKKKQNPNLLTAQEEIELKYKIDNGDELAMDRFIKSNQGLVVSIARRYFGLGLEPLDLIQEGNMGLLRAIKDFDPTKGYKFSTYGYYWIRSSVKQALYKQGRLIKIPVWAEQVLDKLNSFSNEVEQATEMRPTLTEFADNIGMDIKKIEAIVIPAKKSASLDTPISSTSEQNVLLGDTIADPTTNNLSARMEAIDLRKEMFRGLDTIPPRYKRILEMRYNLDGLGERGLDEIAVEFGISGERVRQLEELALTKLRICSSAEKLKEYYRWQPIEEEPKKSSKKLKS